MDEKVGKWLIMGGIAMVILAIGMFGLAYYMVGGVHYGGITIVGNLGTIFLIAGIIVMMIGGIKRRKI